MFGMGMGELIIVAIVALLALGPDKLPGAAKRIGKTIRDLRKQTSQLKKTIEEDSQLGDAVKEIKQALRDDPFRDPPKPKPRPKPKKAEGDKAEGDKAEGDKAGGDKVEGDKAGGDEAGGDEVEGEAGEGEAEVVAKPDGDDTSDDEASDDGPTVAADEQAIPVEPRMINMSEFQKYVHMWGPAAAAEKYGTSMEEAEAAIDAVVTQAAASKRDADG